jgi:hypothetical protein
MFFLALAALCSFTTAAFADEYVNGYTRSNGTQVDGYYRSSPNNTQTDNFSTQGNVNPYTGESGHRRAQY